MRWGIKILGGLYIGIKELPDEIALPTNARQRVHVDMRVSPSPYAISYQYKAIISIDRHRVFCHYPNSDEQDKNCRVSPGFL